MGKTINYGQEFDFAGIFRAREDAYANPMPEQGEIGIADMTLAQLETKVNEILDKQRSISSLGLSAEVTASALGETQAEKVTYLRAMRDKVNALCEGTDITC